MPDSDALAEILERIDGRGYRAYRDIRGAFDFAGARLYIDHVQSDPFAAPSKLRFRVPMERAQLPSELFQNRVREIALADFLARRIRDALQEEIPRSTGTGKSGRVSIDAGGQEVLERCAVKLTPDWVEARLSAGLPASGRRARGREAAQLLCRILPSAVERGLLWTELPHDEARDFVHCVENQESLRSQLRHHELVAFVANGSILPRKSGDSDRPLTGEEVVPFHSPPSLELEFELPNPIRSGETPPTSTVRGMGIPRGITLIVGGGYHGKSTLLQALERGIHPHVPGDGREGVVSAGPLAKIRAEDGRAVTGVDISPFIGELPGVGKGRDTRHFSSQDASGSTSQAASTAEALEAGAQGLLLDEDTCATNFMVRDDRMQALVASENEPITPFVDRVRELFETRGISTVLVMGGSGAYFETADRVIAMNDYRAEDVTEAAHAIAHAQPTARIPTASAPMRPAPARKPDPRSLDPSRGRRDVKVDARGCDRIAFGTSEIDLRGLEQLLDPSQARAIALALVRIRQHAQETPSNLSEILDAIESEIDAQGLETLDPFGSRGEHPGSLARPRRIEIAAALNRLRSLQLR